MNRIFYLVLGLLLSTGTVNATIHMVEVGGGPSPAPSPYYLPQNLTIDVGDTVQWNIVGGTHNMTSTQGPVSFASPDLSTGATWQFVFTVAGVYDYECDRFNHAATQFGTITVNELVGLADLTNNALEVFPNPFSNLGSSFSL